MTQERLLRSVIDSLDGQLCIVAGDGRILGVNRGWQEFAATFGDQFVIPGHPGDVGTDVHLLLKRLDAPLGGEIRDLVRSAILRSSGGGSVRGRLTHHGRTAHVVARVHPVRDHAQARAVLQLVDITERAVTEHELARVTEEARLLSLVARYIEHGVFIALGDGQLEWANEPFHAMTNFPADSIAGGAMSESVRDAIARSPELSEVWGRMLAGIGSDIEFPILDDTGRWYRLVVSPVTDPDGPPRFVALMYDVTAKREDERLLREAHQQARTLAAELGAERSMLSTIIETLPHVTYLKDADQRYRVANNAFLRARGLPDDFDPAGLDESQLPVTDELSSVIARAEAEVLRTGRAVDHIPVTIRAPGAGTRALMLSVLPQADERGSNSSDAGPSAVAGLIGVATDITRISELERQLARTNRLEALGQLAAGVAHEINTPIQFVSDNATFVGESLAQILPVLVRLRDLLEAGDTAECACHGSPRWQEIRAILHAVDVDFVTHEVPLAIEQSLDGLARATKIVRAMREFSHPSHEKSDADLNRAIETTVQVCRNEWRYLATVDLDLDPEVGLVSCVESDIKQVLLNMIVNAAHSIDEPDEPGSRPAGRIRITTRRADDCVTVEIADNGCGMTDEVKERVFDPFFTTKEVGKGTGQGLSLAHAIVVAKHGGVIDVRSSPGWGTTFVVRLPSVRRSPPPAPS